MSTTFNSKTFATKKIPDNWAKLASKEIKGDPESLNWESSVSFFKQLGYKKGLLSVHNASLYSKVNLHQVLKNKQGLNEESFTITY